MCLIWLLCTRMRACRRTWDAWSCPSAPTCRCHMWCVPNLAAVHAHAHAGAHGPPGAAHQRLHRRHQVGARQQRAHAAGTCPSFTNLPPPRPPALLHLDMPGMTDSCWGFLMCIFCMQPAVKTELQSADVGIVMVINGFSCAGHLRHCRRRRLAGHHAGHHAPHPEPHAGARACTCLHLCSCPT